MINLFGVDLFGGFNEKYQRLFNKETATGDFEREGSNQVYRQYTDKRLKKLINGPTAQKLMAEKGTKYPHEIMPELYVAFCREREHPTGKMGEYIPDSVIQKKVISKMINVIYPYYIEEMARRIEEGPDFEDKSYFELCEEYAIGGPWETIPDEFDMAKIFAILDKKCHIDFNLKRVESGHGLLVVYSKTTPQKVLVE